MAAASGSGGAKPAKAAGAAKKSNEEVFAGFQTLRAEQRQLANKISELEMDLNEHKIVVDTLTGVEKERRCFRLVGGVLVERTVGEVLPTLIENRDRLPQALSSLHEQLTRKGQQINEYIETHDIRVQREEPAPAPALDDAKNTNVLVAAN